MTGRYGKNVYIIYRKLPSIVNVNILITIYMLPRAFLRKKFFSEEFKKDIILKNIFIFSTYS